MKLHRLDIEDFRGFETASIEFHKNFTLLIGINGSGKTSILEALKICLSRIQENYTKRKYQRLFFTDEDVRIDKTHMNIDLVVSVMNDSMTIHEFNAHSSVERKIIKEKNRVSVLAKSGSSISNAKLLWKKFNDSKKPVCVYYSTDRAYLPNRKLTKSDISWEQEAAYSDSLSGKEINLVRLAAWVSAQEGLSKEKQRSGLRLNALNKAVKKFLPDCGGLKVKKDKFPSLTVTKKRKTLDAKQLSHGERGFLGLVLDLTRRLALANPEIRDPARNCEGIVLIDEIDLHLHPQWQRSVVDQLCRTFPKCQFVATTHSPLVIGEVRPDQIILIEDGEIHTPSRTFGVDSNEILEVLMEAPPRKQEVQDAIIRIFDLIDERKRKKAYAEIGKLEEKVGKDDPIVIRARTRLRLQESD